MASPMDLAIRPAADKMAKSEEIAEEPGAETTTTTTAPSPSATPQLESKVFPRFPQFSQLPQELQDLIWDNCSNPPSQACVQAVGVFSQLDCWEEDATVELNLPSWDLARRSHYYHMTVDVRPACLMASQAVVKARSRWEQEEAAELAALNSNPDVSSYDVNKQRTMATIHLPKARLGKKPRLPWETSSRNKHVRVLFNPQLDIIWLDCAFGFNGRWIHESLAELLLLESTTDYSGLVELAPVHQLAIEFDGSTFHKYCISCKFLAKDRKKFEKWYRAQPEPREGKEDARSSVLQALYSAFRYVTLEDLDEHQKAEAKKWFMQSHARDLLRRHRWWMSRDLEKLRVFSAERETYYGETFDFDKFLEALPLLQRVYEVFEHEHNRFERDHGKYDPLDFDPETGKPICLAGQPLPAGRFPPPRPHRVVWCANAKAIARFWPVITPHLRTIFVIDRRIRIKPGASIPAGSRTYQGNGCLFVEVLRPRGHERGGEDAVWQYPEAGAWGANAFEFAGGLYNLMERGACSSPARKSANKSPAQTPKSGARAGSRSVKFTNPTPGPSQSTGLTPSLRRATLTATKTHTPRRRSAPAWPPSTPSNGSGIPGLDRNGAPFSGEVRFLPLRQVLDGRIKRRIRRNGLSEEMNAIAAEKRRRAEETRREISRLKAELAEKDAEIERLHDETVVLDTGRVWALEQEVERLKKELERRSGNGGEEEEEWVDASESPCSDGFEDFDVEGGDGFGEASRDGGVFCSTPSKQRVQTSFPTPPATSPEPSVQLTPCRRQPSRLSVAVQADVQDPEKKRLEEEFESLQLEVAKLTAKLESYTALESRLSDKLAPFSPENTSTETEDSSSPTLEDRLTHLLQSLSDKTTALTTLTTSLTSLGFPGSSALEVIDSLRTSLRTARLELEYLNPGELTLPLTGAGSAILELLLARLHDLSTRTREQEEELDEYHVANQSLRAQLDARVTAMDQLAGKLTAAEREARDKDARIAELQVGLDRLKHASETYARDVAELEALVQRVEADLDTSQQENKTLTAELEEKTSTLTRLQKELAAARETQTQLQCELDALSATHAEALELLDSQKDELEGVGEALQEAKETARRLEEEKARLEREKRRAEEVVGGMNEALAKVMMMGQGFLGGVSSSVVGGEGKRGVDESQESTLVSGKEGGEEREGRARKRRKYDSGLGLLEEDEVDGLSLASE
ncbi:hypothetical protein VTJ49DRAFT_6381 [Mycothermus thermophilus]|uniref:Uncharacterized protein n=1 Tax=Humicola insolens TaxID=85995 RepID=A0ABR3VQQ7_HUMIN